MQMFEILIGLILAILLDRALGSLSDSLWAIRKELRGVKRALKYGVRNIPLVTRIVFLNSQGEKVTNMNVGDSGQALKLVLGGEDAAENPAPLDPASAPAYTLDDTSMGSLAPDTDSANPLGQIFTPSGKLGTVNVSVSVPAVNAQPALQGTLAVAVTAGAATQLSLSASVINLTLAPAASNSSGS